ncbi:MAG: hypothetical protein CMA60_05715 [Euryarchaeota archaeon]|nr:hypothetical protein [Euryarchaeota archaeon]|tara:strand:+ start:23016 stop:23615 length:600 start_codon:yes stop_codon:yes gene_type:complete
MRFYMTFKYEDARKELKGRLAKTTAKRDAKHENGPLMVPRIWASQVMDRVGLAADGQWWSQENGGTKAVRLMNAEAGLHLLSPAEGKLQVDMVRFPEREFIELLATLQELARKVRFGNWRLSVKEYDALCLELMNDFCEAFGLKTFEWATDLAQVSRWGEGNKPHYHTNRMELIGHHGYPGFDEKKLLKEMLKPNGGSD